MDNAIAMFVFVGDVINVIVDTVHYFHTNTKLRLWVQSDRYVLIGTINAHIEDLRKALCRIEMARCSRHKIVEFGSVTNTASGGLAVIAYELTCIVRGMDAVRTLAIQQKVVVPPYEVYERDFLTNRTLCVIDSVGYIGVVLSRYKR